jgi:hypothetical protein
MNVITPSHQHDTRLQFNSFTPCIGRWGQAGGVRRRGVQRREFSYRSLPPDIRR